MYHKSTPTHTSTLVSTSTPVSSNFSYSNESSSPSQFLPATGTRYSVMCNDTNGNIVESTMKTDLTDFEIKGDLEVKGDLKVKNIGMKQLYIYNGNYTPSASCPAGTWYTELKSPGSESFTVGSGNKLIQIEYSIWASQSEVDIYGSNTDVYFEIKKADGSAVSTCPKLFNSGYINTGHTHFSFSISRVFTNAQLPAGTYRLTAFVQNAGVVRIDCNDYCQATLIELPSI